MTKHDATEYWRLVHQFSLLGWYRAGRDGNGAAGRAACRFQAGHTTDAAPEQAVQERFVTAASEMAAMRALLIELRRGPDTAHATMPTSTQETQHEGGTSVDASILWVTARAPHQGG